MAIQSLDRETPLPLLAIRAPPQFPCTKTSLYTPGDRFRFSHPNHLSENRTAEEEVPFTFTYMKFSYSNGLDTNLQDQFF